MSASVLALYRRMARWPAGRWIFSRAICLKAPYFSTIAPRFVALEVGRCEVRIRDRRRVHKALSRFVWLIFTHSSVEQGAATGSSASA